MIPYIGPYRVLRAIARGGMAEVYEVLDPVLGEHLALKLLQRAGNALPRFHREYEAMVRLNHPNIVRVYHYGEHEGMPWLTMEMLDGTPVQQYAKDQGVPGTPQRTREVIRIGHDLARALDHLHRRGLVHRDLKSANVIVLPDRRVKLLDFGTAKVEGAIDQITRDNEFLGTFAYASPEQLTGKPIDGRADLYSLGILLYRLFSGVLPFQGEAPAEIARQQLKVAPKPLRDIVPSIPPRVDELVLTLLEKKPAMRPMRGNVVADWLQELAGEPLTLPGTLELRGPSWDRMVGREDQIAAIQAFLDAGWPGTMALLLGQRGSGQDAMMGALEQEVERRGWKHVIVTMRPDDDLSDLEAGLCTLAEGLPGPTMASAATALRKTSESTNILSLAKRREVLRSIGLGVVVEGARAGTGPLVISLRRLQYASVEILDIIKRWRETLRTSSTPVLFAADCEESADVPKSPVRRATKDATRIPLQALDAHKVSLLVGSMLLRRPPPAAVGRKIHSASGGLPTVVGEVIEELVGNGLLRVKGADENRLDWADRSDIAVPKRARETVLDQLRKTNATARRVLEALVVLGGAAPPDTVCRALDLDDTELRYILDPLAAEGVLAVDGETNDVFFRQKLLQRVIDEEMTALRRMLYARRIADDIAQAPIGPAHASVLLRTGMYKDLLPFALTWGQDHLETGLPATALEVLDVVMEKIDDLIWALPDDIADIGRLCLMHALALLRVRPTDLGISRSLARAAQLSTDDELLSELSLARANVNRVVGHYQRYREALQEAWQAIGPSGSILLASRVTSELASAYHRSGLVNEAQDWAKQARALAIKGHGAAELAQAEVAAANLALATGRWPDAEKTLARAIRSCEERGDLATLSEALPLAADLLRLQGRFSEAIAGLDRVAPLLRQAEDPALYVRLLLCQAWVEVDLCRLGRAQECVDELAATLRQGEHLQLRLEAEVVRGRILFESDNRRDAERVLQTVVERARMAELTLLADLARAYRAEVLWSRRRYAEAETEFRGACTRIEASGDKYVLLQASLARVRATSTSADPSALLAPVQRILDLPNAQVPRLIAWLGQARYLVALNQDPKPAAASAREILDRISLRLRDTEREVLRLHPWARQLRAYGV